jgi:2-succinyl-6-hydroxy-2,4-cyclohexadiene-1-carboxylate synthase
MPEVIESVVTEHFDVDVGEGLQLHAVRAGTGPHIVLLHGFTGSAETWATLTGAIGNRYTTLSVELPGHGKSTSPPDAARYRLDRFADDLGRVLDAFHLARAAVLGYSLGGRAALRFALRHPERVEALVLESASPGIIDSPERADRIESDNAIADMIERKGVPSFVDFWEALPLWGSQSGLGTAERAQLRAQRLANNVAGLANSLRGAGAGCDPPVIDALIANRAPTLLIAGELDQKYVVESRLMKAAMPNARRAVVPRTGHAVHLERPAIFAEVVLSFLDEVRAAATEWA